MDGWMYVPTDGWIDGQMDVNPVLLDILPFQTTAQKRHSSPSQWMIWNRWYSFEMSVQLSFPPSYFESTIYSFYPLWKFLPIRPCFCLLTLWLGGLREGPSNPLHRYETPQKCHAIIAPPSSFELGSRQNIYEGDKVLRKSGHFQPRWSDSNLMSGVFTS